MAKIVPPGGNEVLQETGRRAGKVSLCEVTPLAGTSPLEWPEDGLGLSVKMVDGIHAYLERLTRQSLKSRGRAWKRDLSSAESYAASVEPNRQRLREIIGVVDERLPSDMERFGNDRAPALLAENEAFRVFQVRWPVLPDIWGEGLLLDPKADSIGGVVALPDADIDPEGISGFSDSFPPELQYARRLAENGFTVVVPALLSRGCEFSGHPNVCYCNLTHREWIYRQSFQMGRHVIGWEVQKTLAAVDWLTGRGVSRVGVCGYGEGGLIALYAAAVDQRIDAALVSGYFGPRENLWREPIYRNVWSLLTEFGDAEIASLVCPRSLVVEYAAEPDVNYVEPLEYDFTGSNRWAAPGGLVTPDYEAVRAEFDKISVLAGTLGERVLVSDGGRTVGPGSSEAISTFVKMLGVEPRAVSADTTVRGSAGLPDSAQRQKRQIDGIVSHIQTMLHDSDRVRDIFFLGDPDAPRPEPMSRKMRRLRRHLWEEVLGKIADKLPEPNPRTRRIYDEETWTGYDVVLDLTPEFFAWGVLCVPKGIAPGERRPVVVCQHGWEGLPEDTINTEGAWAPYYRSFTAELAKRGFVTFAPHNPYRGGYRYLRQQRKANPLKLSLGAIIIHQHRQILRFLKALPFVDPERIGLHGLSYGGWTASRIPSVLEDYTCSICSACFNDWVRKIVDVTSPMSYMYNPAYEMAEWNAGQTFNNAEMACLMVPRPFMVERGSDDGVSHDSWVLGEYAKVRLFYNKLCIGHRTEIEVFDGGHIINGQGSFKFLHKWLDWPESADRSAADGV